MSVADIIPARELLLQMGSELARCRAILAGLETELNRLDEASRMDRATLQSVDLLDQTLDDLSICANALAVGVPATASCDRSAIASLLRLGDVRLRLTGEPQGTDGNGVKVELF